MASCIGEGRAAYRRDVRERMNRIAKAGRTRRRKRSGEIDETATEGMGWDGVGRGSARVGRVCGFHVAHLPLCPHRNNRRAGRGGGALTTRGWRWGPRSRCRKNSPRSAEIRPKIAAVCTPPARDPPARLSADGAVAAALPVGPRVIVHRGRRPTRAGTAPPARPTFGGILAHLGR